EKRKGYPWMRRNPLVKVARLTRALAKSVSSDSIAHEQRQSNVHDGQNGEGITKRPVNDVPELEDAVRAAEKRDACRALGLGSRVRAGALQPMCARRESMS